MMFKSYYVVWKPHTGEKFARILSCLNRTMQYGNDIMKCKKNKITECLNRTMQYGNKFPNTQNLTTNACLNRTMQYGNNFLYGVKTNHIISFKSYYVVWKHGNAKQGITYTVLFKSYYVVWKRNKRVTPKTKTRLV